MGDGGVGGLAPAHSSLLAPPQLGLPPLFRLHVGEYVVLPNALVPKATLLQRVARSRFKSIFNQRSDLESDCEDGGGGQAAQRLSAVSSWARPLRHIIPYLSSRMPMRPRFSLGFCQDETSSYRPSDLADLQVPGNR